MRTQPRSPFALALLALFSATCVSGVADVASAELKAGAAIVDVTPTQFPVLVNGGMLSNKATKVKTPLHARALVLDDGRERIAIVVVDSCMIDRTLCDDIKQLAAANTRLKPDRILISATHTHTAAASMGCLGTDADPQYVPFVRIKVADAIAAAEKNLAPAEVGWGSADAAEYTALRQWVRRPDRLEKDPFGNFSVRANMHAGRVWDDVTGEAGPEDPELSMIAFRASSGRPIAVLANFSMHYFSDSPISADYFGLFCDGFQNAVAAEAKTGVAGSNDPPFVGILSHGCSGDIWRRDYTKPIPKPEDDHTIDSYTQGLLKIALDAYRKIEYRADADLAMSEARLTIPYRTPDLQRLEWAQRIVAAMGDRLPKDTTEVYAREQILLHERQKTEVVVQGLRIGDFGIATTPCETYAITGLKIKAQSPLAKTMVIELANGGDGYIPPAEHHPLGGYNTWAARSAGLEPAAESKITALALERLEHVAGRPRKKFRVSHGADAQQTLSDQPLAYWRLDDFNPPRARDASGHGRDAHLEPGILCYLAGPRSDRFCLNGETNRSVHLAGGRIAARLEGLGERYTVSLWFWNGLPLDARPLAGWLYSKGAEHGLSSLTEMLGLVGSSESDQQHAGKLVFQLGRDDQPVVRAFGKTAVERWTWHHVRLVRDGGKVRVYLDDAKSPELEVDAPASPAAADAESLYFGGRSDGQSNWEGRLDEISVFDRVLVP
ncbi:MAG: LamG-like jellyroll fold domain-containing protein [Pirellulales bacterium]